jgi:hypothetical protein
MILQSVKNWRANKKRYPTRWLTVKRKIRDDLEETFQKEGAKEFFDEKYISSLAAQIQQLENWQLRLFAVQTAVLGFLAVGFISSDTSISLFGVSLKYAHGLKEVLLGIAVTLGFFLPLITAMKEVRVIIIEKLVELSISPNFTDFAKLAARSSFHVQTYVSKRWSTWIFSALRTKMLSGALFLIGASLIICVFVFSTALQIFIILDIWKNPTLPGMWSYAVVAYAIAGYIFSLLWFIRFNVPLPYLDQSSLKRLQELEKSDPLAYEELRKKIFADKG